MEEEFQDLLNISEFSLGDGDCNLISREMFKQYMADMFKQYMADKNLKGNLAIDDLYDLVVNKQPILVYEDDNIELIRSFKEYKQKILNNGKKDNNL